MLTREFLDSVPKPGKPTPLHVRKWGVEVYIADPTVDQVDEWEAFVDSHKSPAGKALPGPWRATLASILLCDEQGKRLFSASDVSMLGTHDPEALQEIWAAGIGRLRATDAEVEVAEKN